MHGRVKELGDAEDGNRVKGARLLISLSSMTSSSMFFHPSFKARG